MYGEFTIKTGHQCQLERGKADAFYAKTLFSRLANIKTFVSGFCVCVLRPLSCNMRCLVSIKHNLLFTNIRHAPDYVT